ncbi:MAG: CmcJ/NvfI family oxidoreductase [Gammaproteobacteria bacterium]|nr:CmcJ/NvfI family oxidoreductase [Gammaproteobacteria bacterium]
MSTLTPHEVNVPLNGLFSPDYVNDQKTIIDVKQYNQLDGQLPPIATDIRNGRELQIREDDGSPDFISKFFIKHGFVLLSHKSAVTDWDSGAFGAGDALSIEGVDRHVAPKATENQIATRYHAEVDDLIQNQILPGRKLRIQQPDLLLRRGLGTAHPFYGNGVHNDYGISADDFQENSVAFGDENQARQWRASFDDDEVLGYLMINFWRAVHMSEPVRHMPLAILDAQSVERADLVPSGLKGFTHTGRITNQLNLRHNERHRWYYYPEMTVDEVLVLNLYHCFKDDRDHSFHQCFHSAFDNPLAPEGAEVRQSCEHRVGVHVLRD